MRTRDSVKMMPGPGAHRLEAAELPRRDALAGLAWVGGLAVVAALIAAPAHAQDAEPGTVLVRKAPTAEGFRFGWPMERAAQECARRGLSIGRGEHSLSCIGPKIGQKIGVPAANELLLTFCDGELCRAALAWLAGNVSRTQASRARAALEDQYGAPGDDGWALVHDRTVYVVVADLDGEGADTITYFGPTWHSSSKPGTERGGRLDWEEPKGWTPKEVGGVPLRADRAAVLNACRGAGLDTQAHADQIVCEGALRSMFGGSRPERLAFRFCEGSVVCEVDAYWPRGTADALREAIGRTYGPGIPTDDAYSWNQWGAWSLTLYEVNFAIVRLRSRTNVPPDNLASGRTKP